MSDAPPATLVLLDDHDTTKNELRILKPRLYVPQAHWQAARDFIINAFQTHWHFITQTAPRLQVAD